MRGASLHRALCTGATLDEVLPLLTSWVKSFGEPVGFILRHECLRLTPRKPGVSDSRIFPVPLLPASLPRRGRRRERWRHDEAARRLCNLWLAFLNDGYSGAAVATVCKLQPGAAQRRIQLSLLGRARVFLRDVGSYSLGGEADIRDFARLAGDDYSGACVARPLGTRAGIPDKAGLVDVADALRADRPDLSVQCEDPTSLLVDPPQFAADPEKICKFLDKTYPSYIKAVVRADFKTMRDLEGIAVVEGRRIENGGFAVAKNAAEDRGISPSS